MCWNLDLNYSRHNVNLEDKLKREAMAEVINFISSKEKRGKMVSKLENIQKRRDEVRDSLIQKRRDEVRDSLNIT